MAYSIIKWNETDQGSKIANYQEIGIRRYQPNAGEQKRSEFWQSRESIIETFRKNFLFPIDISRYCVYTFLKYIT